jgi:hypothetical protein
MFVTWVEAMWPTIWYAQFEANKGRVEGGMENCCPDKYRWRYHNPTMVRKVLLAHGRQWSLHFQIFKLFKILEHLQPRLRPSGRNPAIFSPGLDVKRTWVGDFFQSSPGVRGYSFKIASSRPLHKSIAQSSAIGSATIRRSKHKLD